MLTQHRTTQTTDFVLGAVGLRRAEEGLVLGELDEHKEPLLMLSQPQQPNTCGGYGVAIWGCLVV